MDCKDSKPPKNPIAYAENNMVSHNLFSIINRFCLESTTVDYAGSTYTVRTTIPRDEIFSTQFQKLKVSVAIFMAKSRYINT